MKQGHIHLCIDSYIAMYIHKIGVPRCAMYIHCILFIHLHTLQSIHSFICSIDQKKVFDELTSVCRRRRLPLVHDRPAVAEEEAGSSGIDGGGADRLDRRR
jgi:hypothetical protein